MQENQQPGGNVQPLIPTLKRRFQINNLTLHFKRIKKEKAS